MALGFSGRRLDGSRTMETAQQSISGAFFQQSSFATHSVIPARNLIRVDDDVDPVLRAAIPCGVITGAGSVLNTFRISPQESLAVFGAGTVGLSAIMAAKLAGVRPLIAIDVLQERLDLALEFGATHGVRADGDVARQIRDIAPKGVDFTLETSGNETALNEAIMSLKTGGRCGMVIAPHMGRKYPFSTSEIFKRAVALEGIIQGSCVPRTFLPHVLRWIRDGRLPVNRLIGTYTFDEINRAFRDAREGKVVKAVIRFD
jgi:aryl-alcohol dehydrogenase